MAINPDVLATALVDLQPKFSALFTKWHPILDRIVKGGNVQRKALQGYQLEFTVLTDGPGAVTQIMSGNEVLAGGRRQNAHRGLAEASRMIYHFDVPGIDLALANGEMDLAEILKNYPTAGLDDFYERMASQIGTGNGSEVGGFTTLNGDTNYNPAGTQREGALDFATAANQNQAVFGLMKQGGASGISGWYNQYANITDFGLNGRRRMREVYFECSRQGRSSGPVDLMLGDPASYLNYLDDLDEHVRTTKVENDHVPGNVRQGVKFLEADFFLEEAIDTSAPAFTARNGVIYFLKTNTWRLFTAGHNAKMETKGFFDTRGPIRIPEQDMWRYELVLHMGLYCNQLRANGCVDGSAVE